MNFIKKNFISNHEEDTKKFAREFASSLNKGNIVLIEGDVGAGKTYICREIIRYFCEETVNVPSPTFNILQTYEASTFDIYHYDFYRLKSQNELQELAIEESLNNNLVLIEWPELVLNIMPSNSIQLKIEVIENNIRQILIYRPEIN